MWAEEQFLRAVGCYAIYDCCIDVWLFKVEDKIYELVRDKEVISVVFDSICYYSMYIDANIWTNGFKISDRHYYFISIV